MLTFLKSCRIISTLIGIYINFEEGSTYAGFVDLKLLI